MTCRICLEDGELISPCHCTGTTAHVHEECLVRWLNMSGRTDCEICKFRYLFEEVEVRKCVLCPKWSCGSSMGFMFAFLLLSVPVTTMISDLGAEDVFFACNLVFWGLVLYEKDHECIVERAVFWKLGLCAGQFLVALRYQYWFYFKVEAVLSFLLFLVVYIYLCCDQAKQVVHYIYTRDNT